MQILHAEPLKMVQPGSQNCDGAYLKIYFQLFHFLGFFFLLSVGIIIKYCWSRLIHIDLRYSMVWALSAILQLPFAF